MDRERAMKGLEIILNGCDEIQCEDCCFHIKEPAKPRRCGMIEEQIQEEALALLKEQEEKKGQWIPIESPTGVESFGIKEMTVQDVRCSVCDAKEDVSFAAYRFCPRCGAKMEGR